MVEAGRTLFRASCVIARRRNERQGELDRADRRQEERKEVGSSADSLVIIIIQHTFIFSWVLWVGLFVQVKGG